MQVTVQIPYLVLSPQLAAVVVVDTVALVTLVVLAVVLVLTVIALLVVLVLLIKVLLVVLVLTHKAVEVAVLAVLEQATKKVALVFPITLLVLLYFMQAVAVQHKQTRLHLAVVAMVVAVTLAALAPKAPMDLAVEVAQVVAAEPILAVEVEMVLLSLDTLTQEQSLLVLA
jgi:hypothetical protein